MFYFVIKTCDTGHSALLIHRHNITVYINFNMNAVHTRKQSNLCILCFLFKKTTDNQKVHKSTVNVTESISSIGKSTIKILMILILAYGHRSA